MGRIRQYIDVGDQKHWALFDSGARNTYVTSEVAKHLPTFDMPKINPVAIAGKTHHIKKDCRLAGIVEGYNILTDAFIIDDIGIDEDGKPIEILFGALAMQQWGIKLNLPDETLDMSHYSNEFVEF